MHYIKIIEKPNQSIGNELKIVGMNFVNQSKSPLVTGGQLGNHIILFPLTADNNPSTHGSLFWSAVPERKQHTKQYRSRFVRVGSVPPPPTQHRNPLPLNRDENFLRTQDDFHLGNTTAERPLIDGNPQPTQSPNRKRTFQCKLAAMG